MSFKYKDDEDEKEKEFDSDSNNKKDKNKKMIKSKSKSITSNNILFEKSSDDNDRSFSDKYLDKYQNEFSEETEFFLHDVRIMISQVATVYNR